VPRVWRAADSDQACSGPVIFLDDITLAAGTWDGDAGVVRLWDVKPGEPTPLHAFRGHTGKIASLSCAAGPRLLVSTGLDEEQTVRVWDTAGKRELHRFTGASNGQLGVAALSPDGGLLAFGHFEQTIGVLKEPNYAVWLRDLTGQAPRSLSPLPGHAGPVTAIAFAPDGQRVATADEEGRLVHWDLANNRNLGDCRLPGRINALAFSPEGRHLAVGNGNGTIYIFRLQNLGRQ